jgi:hypothetical protein
MKKNSQNIWYRPCVKMCFHILRVIKPSSRPCGCNHTSTGRQTQRLSHTRSTEGNIRISWHTQ